MTILLLCLVVIIVALVWRASRVPIKHRWRRRQAQIMSEAIRGRDRSQPPEVIYALIVLPERTPDALLANKGYDADAICADLAKRNIESVILGRSN